MSFNHMGGVYKALKDSEDGGKTVIMECKVCKDKIIENEANQKKFWYCRTCKDERTAWGHELPKPEPEKTEERKVYAKSDLYGTYGGGHNQSTGLSHPSSDPYY